jgi:hypothetical protein
MTRAKKTRRPLRGRPWQKWIGDESVDGDPTGRPSRDIKLYTFDTETSDNRRMLTGWRPSTKSQSARRLVGIAARC